MSLYNPFDLGTREGLVVIGFLSIVVALLRHLRNNKSYPPGPRGPPIIGAALSIPKEQEWVTFTQWKDRYGPIVGMEVMNQRIVLLNTSELAHELFTNRSTMYAERPSLPMLEMMGFPEWNIGIMRRGPRHTLTRRMMIQSLSTRAIIDFDEITQEEVNRLLLRMLESPAEFMTHLRNIMVTLMIRMFYGLEVHKDRNTEFVKLNDDLIAAGSRAAAPAGYFVNLFPLLRHWPASFPGAGFQKKAIEGRILAARMFAFPLEVLEKKISENKAAPSFLTHHLQGDGDADHKFAAQAVAATAYAAGVETSTSVLLTFVLAMVLYPNVQKRAHEEIDRVIPDKLPTVDDMDKLPLVTAVLMECYRWAPPGPLGLPRYLVEDDIIEGYTIPRGTIVMSNIWGILRDERNYPRPSEFVPERFMGKNPQPDPREHIFGYGRRICPGKYLGERILWLSVASILASFEISPKLDIQGRPLLPAFDYTSGVMSRPKDFSCHIVPRSPVATHRIRELY